MKGVRRADRRSRSVVGGQQAFLVAKEPVMRRSAAALLARPSAVLTSPPLAGLVLEQSISTNTTAAGGNAHLMTIG